MNQGLEARTYGQVFRCSEGIGILGKGFTCLVQELISESRVVGLGLRMWRGLLRVEGIWP